MIAIFAAMTSKVAHLALPRKVAIVLIELSCLQRCPAGYYWIPRCAELAIRDPAGGCVFFCISFMFAVEVNIKILG